MNDKRNTRKLQIEKNLLDFVGTRSDTNSLEEKNVEQFFQNWFERVTYFKENKGNCGLYTIEKDHLNRKVPWALLKGEGTDTIVFIHHHDIVETKDFGILEPLSLKPYELMEAFRQGKMDLPAEAKVDLLSEEWLFGRGISDMKGGGSIQISLMEEYSKESNFKGNIVLISVPDEENLSAGMRGATILLKELKDQHGLNYVLMLNAEPHERGENLKPTLYDGSIGKIMPVFYVRGKLAHAGQVYSGLNPINLLAEIIRKTEINPDFIEKVGNTVNPPPTWLYHKDRKTVYDVSLPIATCGYMSILPLEKTPKELMDSLKSISVKAFEAVIQNMNQSYAVYTATAGLEAKKLPWKPKVKLYAELFEDAKRDAGVTFEEEYNLLMKDITEQFHQSKITTIEAANQIIEKTLTFVKDLSPVVVIALTPPYYPSTNNRMLKEKSEKIYKITEEVLAYAKEEFQETYTVQNYFTGISDLSYAMFVSDQSNIDYIANNMLMWNHSYYIPLEIIKEISMPVINVGPWGKDLHKYTERVNKKDLLERTPQLIDLYVRKLLGNEEK